MEEDSLISWTYLELDLLIFHFTQTFVVVLIE